MRTHRRAGWRGTRSRKAKGRRRPRRGLAAPAGAARLRELDTPTREAHTRRHIAQRFASRRARFLLSCQRKLPVALADAGRVDDQALLAALHFQDELRNQRIGDFFETNNPSPQLPPLPKTSLTQRTPRTKPPCHTRSLTTARNQPPSPRSCVSMVSRLDAAQTALASEVAANAGCGPVAAVKMPRQLSPNRRNRSGRYWSSGGPKRSPRAGRRRRSRVPRRA